MSYSHANIERLANMIRNDLKLSTPITASTLQSAMQKELGIIFQSNIHHRSTVCEIKHPDLNQYIVVYNPKWDEIRIRPANQSFFFQSVSNTFTSNRNIHQNL